MSKAEATVPSPRTALLVHTTYFPYTAPGGGASHAAQLAHALGQTLYGIMCRERSNPLSQHHGAQVRIGTAPSRIDGGAADKVFVIAIISSEGAAPSEAGEAIQASLARWQKQGQPPTVLPVVLPSPARSSARLGLQDALSQEAFTDILLGWPLSEQILHQIATHLGAERSGRRIFVSHTHSESEGGLTTQILAELQAELSASGYGSGFFNGPPIDSAKGLVRALSAINARRDAPAMPPHAHNETQGPRLTPVPDSHGVLIVLRSGGYGANPTCRHELLLARKLRLPILVVEVDEQGDGRGSAYLGQSPTIQWAGSLGAKAVLQKAVTECVRQLVFSVVGRRMIQDAHFPDEAVEIMTRPPDLLDLAYLGHGPNAPRAILHPEPQLSIHEQRVLALHRNDLKFLTPTTAFQRERDLDPASYGKNATGESAVRSPLSGWQVGLSLSHAPHLEDAEGLIPEHVWDATTFLARSLIAQGAALAYGGDFRSTGYTPHLINTIASYNQTRREINAADLLHAYLGAPLRDTLPSPRRLRFTPHYPDLPDTHPSPRPGQEPYAAVLPGPQQHISRLSSLQKALYFCEMRRFMEAHIRARIIISGDTQPKDPDANIPGYGGPFPGVLEETWRSLEAGIPLYIVGGFGGVAGLIADLASPGDGTQPLPPELQLKTWENNQHFTTLGAAFRASKHRAALGLPPTIEALAIKVRARLQALLNDSFNDSTLSWNGLTVSENRRLARATDPMVISTLILRGLKAVQRQQTDGQLTIELVKGSVTTSSDLELLAFPVLEDEKPRGAGYAIDQITHGEADAARLHADRLLAVRSDDLDVHYLLALNLGRREDLYKDVVDGESEAETQRRQVGRIIARAKAAAERLVTIAGEVGHGFKKIGVVTFGASLCHDYRRLAQTLLTALQALGPSVELLWFETEDDRAQILEEIFEGREGVIHTVREVPLDVGSYAPPPPRESIIHVGADGERLRVSILPNAINGIAPTFHPTADAQLLASLVVAPNEAGQNAVAFRERGGKLADLMFGTDGFDLACPDESVRMRIIHDPKIATLPFESMVVDRPTQAITPSTHGGILRTLGVEVKNPFVAARRPPRRGMLRVLLVAPRFRDIPTEAQAMEIEALLAPLPVRVVTLYGGDATQENVLGKLEEGDIDLFHYCGHGTYFEEDPNYSGLMLGPRLNLPANRLCELHNPPRVAVFNACTTARVSSTQLEGKRAHTFAERFLQAGTQAVLGTLWPVVTGSSAPFSSQLYRSLSEGATLADALLAARRRLKNGRAGGSNQDAEQGHPTDWANYVLYGDGDFQLVRKMS